MGLAQNPDKAEFQGCLTSPWNLGTAVGTWMIHGTHGGADVPLFLALLLPMSWEVSGGSAAMASHVLLG